MFSKDLIFRMTYEHSESGALLALNREMKESIRNCAGRSATDQEARDVSTKLFQKNSFNSSLKLPSYIFRLQIEGQSCGRDDTEVYRFNNNTYSLPLIFQTNDYYNSDY
ncbi:hypothetical protein ACS0TY_008729 [Phlomoides rotata]